MSKISKNGMEQQLDTHYYTQQALSIIRTPNHSLSNHYYIDLLSVCVKSIHVAIIVFLNETPIIFNG